MIDVNEIHSFLWRRRNTTIYDRASIIYEMDGVEIVSLDEEKGTAECKVQSQSSRKKYKVQLSNLDNQAKISCSCNCPYDGGAYCKHMLAALMAIKDVHLSTLKDDPEQIKTLLNALTLFDSTSPQVEKSPPPLQAVPNKKRSSKKKAVSKNSPVVMEESIPEALSVYHVAHYTDFRGENDWLAQSLIPKITHWEQKENQFYGEIMYRKKYRTTITIDKSGLVSCTCNCGPRAEVFCKHAFALLLANAQKNDLHEDVLFPIRDHTAEIEKAIQMYGYTLKDPWQDFFFVYEEKAKIIVTPKNQNLSKTSKYASWDEEVSKWIKPSTALPAQRLKEFSTDFEYGVYWTDIATTHPLPYLYTIEGKRRKNGEFKTSLKVLKDHDSPRVKLSRKYRTLYFAIQEIQPDLYLDEYGLSYRTLDHIDTIIDCQNQFIRDLHQFVEKFQHETHIVSTGEDAFTYLARHVIEVFPQLERPSLSFVLSKSDTHFILEPRLHIKDSVLPYSDFTQLNYGIVYTKNELYILSEQDARTMFFFLRRESYMIRHEDIESFSEEFLLPLAEQYPLEADGFKLPLKKTDDVQLKKLVYLKEIEDYLVLVPAFKYQLTHNEKAFKEALFDGGQNLIIPDEDSDEYFLIPRKTELEQENQVWFASLHPSFEENQGSYYTLHTRNLLKDRWFFKAFDQLVSNDFEVLGLKNLTKLNYSPHKPNIRLKAGSGIDWFDLTVDISFGDEKVKLADIRKAVMKRQDYVTLGNGMKGLLPKEWLEKYSYLLKMGKVAKDTLKFTQFQVGLIDELYEEIDQHDVLLNLLEKQRRLRSFSGIEKVPVPNEVNAQLRNYQIEGYNWLNFLDEYGWGGCLADDMGLGKTLQVLSLLAKVSNDHPSATHLIVVPRSLVFNWMEEVEKFCQHLSVLNYTGADRKQYQKEFDQYQLIITTYGLVRSDISFLKSYLFHYVVLDESQAIKNPTTQAAKSVKLLQAHNRLIMTGTPVENNTFDLYSQMDFLNPGMLGNMKQFKDQFANPIDKDKDETATQQLRKLVYPFILSRKKQEVAKELPEKTEITLYCEMKPGQRKVYDYYKQKYRRLLTETIEEKGLAQSGMYILQGLNKLRQICNSPALASSEEDEQDAGFTDQSIKLDMLMDRLEEIISEGHRVLIFSFFTGMLALIEEQLQSAGIPSIKLTGQSTDRKSLVNEFKSNDSLKVFLISLKAGGFGLNLTEASYVFLIDPWWNPAVEQQAIDRTHRIGQDQQVFAYKFICKDTIEEKILSLQEKKKVLADDIVHTETGFLKKLTQEDVKALFD